jgi:hypothetical protein
MLNELKQNSSKLKREKRREKTRAANRGKQRQQLQSIFADKLVPTFER